MIQENGRQPSRHANDISFPKKLENGQQKETDFINFVYIFHQENENGMSISSYRRSGLLENWSFILLFLLFVIGLTMTWQKCPDRLRLLNRKTLGRIEHIFAFLISLVFVLRILWLLSPFSWSRSTQRSGYNLPPLSTSGSCMINSLKLAYTILCAPLIALLSLAPTFGLHCKDGFNNFHLRYKCATSE